MAHLVGDIAKYFKWEEIDVDNNVFKLFYQGCVIIFFTGSLVGVMSQYFGEPINCDFKGIDSEMASDYCWIHGSSYIPPEYQRHMKCIVDQDGIESADDAPDTSYYQVRNKLNQSRNLLNKRVNNFVTIRSNSLLLFFAPQHTILTLF